MQVEKWWRMLSVKEIAYWDYVCRKIYGVITWQKISSSHSGDRRVVLLG